MSHKIIDPSGIPFIWKEIEHDKYKYELVYNYNVLLQFKPSQTIISDFYVFESNGKLSIRKGYLCDGASGPTMDTLSNMRAAFVHDVIYQMLRRGELGQVYKNPGDLELHRLMIEDYSPSWFGGSLWSRFRANYYYQGVRFFGGGSCRRS